MLTLNWTFAYCSFNNCWLCFNFWIASLVCVSVGITSSAVEINICAITAGIKKHKSIIKKNKKKHDKIVLLAKDKLNTIDVLITSLIDSYIHTLIDSQSVSVNNVLREWNEMKEETKKSETTVEYTI